MAAPTPSAPKPGADWVPTADGQGWLPPDQAGSPAAWKEPAAPATPPPSADPYTPPSRVAAPVLGPLVDNPATGTATHDPAQAIPPTPTRTTGPELGPLVDNGGTATHDPSVTLPPYEPQPVAPSAPAPPPEPNGGYIPKDPSGDPTPPPLDYGSPVPSTPAAPTTATKSGQDLYRDLLIQQMGQQEIPNVNDAAIKAQLDPYAAAQTRAMRDEIRSGAEAAFAGDQDFGVPERVAAAERAGQNTGLQASDLVGREMMARRDQIKDALGKFGATLDADQQRALQEKLAQIQLALDNRKIDVSERQGDRSLDLNEKELELKKYLGDKDIGIQLSDQDIRKLALTQTGQLGNRELDIRDKLGTMGLNSDMVRTLLADAQFRLQFGLDVGKTQADLNRDATIQGMG